MGIDASIYSNVKQPGPISPIDNAQKAMTLSSLGMQQAQMQRQMMTQQAAQHAYLANTDQNGNLNREGFLSELSKTNPQAAMEHQQQFYAQDKSHAEAQAAQADAAQKTLSFTIPMMHHLAGMPEEQRAAAYGKVMEQLRSYGVDTSKMSSTYDPGLFRETYGRIDAAGANAKQLLENQKTQAETAKSYAEAGKASSETYKRNPDILGQTNDPAKLVPGVVPKEHQAKAFNEIDAAENTKRMSGNIMDAFDQATKDIQGTGRVTSLLKTPRSAQALHQALQPTFKDLEGTVRQAAMDNTFKNVTPNAADTANDIATKRQALEEYLQSKASAPTARAYGIDLSKFDSTSAYKSKAPKTSQAGGSGGIASANASDLLPPPEHGTVDSGYVFMGGDASKESNWKKH